jgi:Na+/phosphate symporter
MILPPVFLFLAQAPNAKTVSAWAQLVEKHGGALVVGVTLGLFFLLLSTLLVRKMLKSSEVEDKRRAEREKEIDTERRDMTTSVIELTSSSVSAIQEITKELVEFRRDTHRAFSELGAEIGEVSGAVERILGRLDHVEETMNSCPVIQSADR